jgi:glyoxylase-like metal-dependent hydrolase (beta-lactamase superfamily II)
MREFRVIAMVSLATLVWAGGGVARAQQPEGEPFSRAIRKLKDGFYVVPGYDGATTGGNVGVRVTSDGIVLVDSNKVENIADVLRQVRTVSTLPIKFALGTHSHADHSGGNAELAKGGTVLIAHRNMRNGMVQGKQAAPPAIVYDTELSLFLGGSEVRAYYFGPGHTDGDSVIYFPDVRAVQLGDLVVWGKRLDGSTLVPAINYPTGATLSKLLATIDGLLKLDFDTAIPGHGPVLTKAQLQTYREKLGTLKQRMRDAVRTGAKKEELSKTIKLDDLGWPLAQGLLASMYDEVAAEK